MNIGSRSELTAQLVIEVMVKNLERSLAFYQALGFEVQRSSDSFAVLCWDNSYLFLDEMKTQSAPTSALLANVRVMVQDVDQAWQCAQSLGADVESPLTEQAYGLRDFTIRDPDGFGVRFAQLVEGVENLY